MAEEAPKYRELRVAEVERFMKAHGIDEPKCPMCAKTTWYVGLPSRHPALALPAMADDGTALLGEFSPVLPLFCGNCAYVWLASYDSIMEWLSQDSPVREEEAGANKDEANG